MAGRDIKITIIGDASKAQKAFNDAGTSAGTFEGKIDGLGSKFGTFAGTLAGVATGGALAALPGLLMDGAKGAAEDEAAMLRLRKAVENTGKSYDSQSGAVEDAIKRGQELAFTDGETASALATLTSLTGDSDEALRRLSAAQDLARGTGIPLEQAAKLLGKTSDENTTALNRLGIQVGENATAQDVLNAVDEKYKGQAGTFAESQAGQMLKAQQASGELAESFGSLLLPVIAILTAALLKISEVIQTHIVPAFQGIIDAVTPVAEFIGGFIADNIGPFVAALVGVGAAILAVVIPAMVAWVAGTLPVIAAHITMAAAVIAAYLPIIAIVAAVGVAAALLYAAWESNLFGIRDITQQVWDFVRPYFESAVNAIRTVVETVFPIIAQIVTTYIGILRTEIELGVAAARWAFDNVFVPIQGIVSDVFTTIAGLVTTLWGPTVTAIGVGVDGVKTAFDGLAYIQGVVSDIFSTISGLVASLWLGASGAVGMIGAGLATVYGFFAGAYDKMYGFAQSMVQGLIDGARSLIGVFEGVWNTISAIADKIIAAKNLISSPSKLMHLRGQQMMQGLIGGTASMIPAYASVLNEVAGMGGRYLGGDSTWSHPGADSVSAPFTSPSGHFANPQSGGGGSSIGSVAARGGGNDDFLNRFEKLLTQHADRVERAVERGSNRALRGAI